MRDSFVFYRSFYDSIKLLPKKYQFAFVQALCEYALNEVLPESLPGGSMALFNALKPQIDANNRRYENGCKGGRPPKPSDNQTETKPKPNNNQSKTKPKPNDNVNDNDNVNVYVDGDVYVHDNDNALASSGGRSLDDKYNIWKMLGGDGIDAVYDAFPETGGLLLQEVYEDIKAKGKTIKNPLSYVMGYAKNKKWSDEADHFVAPWEAM